MSAPPPERGQEFLLSVYDTWQSGAPEHVRLAGARPIGPAVTAPSFDLGAQAALVPGATTAVRREVYALSPAALAVLDVPQSHPLRLKRRTVRLEDGREVEASTLDADQTRSRRRIRSGDWRSHAEPA